jgi:hypothetical protein
MVGRQTPEIADFETNGRTFLKTSLITPIDARAGTWESSYASPSRPKRCKAAMIATPESRRLQAVMQHIE